MSTDYSFTTQEFSKQVVEFRQLFGDRRFWAKPSPERQKAVDGLTFAYTNTKTVTPEEERSLKTLFGATITEYVRREGMMASYGKVGL
jgi:hypothetical protein